MSMSERFRLFNNVNKFRQGLIFYSHPGTIRSLIAGDPELKDLTPSEVDGAWAQVQELSVVISERSEFARDITSTDCDW